MSFHISLPQNGVELLVEILINPVGDLNAYLLESKSTTLLPEHLHESIYAPLQERKPVLWTGFAPISLQNNLVSSLSINISSYFILICRQIPTGLFEVKNTALFF
jgi:hypothetical protein